ncbi:hypothetical protein [Hasllibacter sp. MH4015]|uniref:hypothetical protein n=1 Tax=Hasllibacter sp. MH4015 TaxID=2854029 RepID=UPI001CD4465F|nr:hypothetical protein [Hasllibacter sp. MH4015]
MHVILHVGAHRTATTTFQTHLAHHRPLLHDAKCGYWGPKITRGGLFGQAMGARHTPFPGEMPRMAKRVAMRVEQARQRGITRLIVSDENMLGSLRNCLEDTALYRDAGQRLATLAGGFGKHRVTIAIGLRAYDDWWTSALAFRLLRAGPLPKDRLREYLVTQPRRWRHVVEDVARAVPSAHIAVWTYEALGAHPDRVLSELTDIATPAPDARTLNARPDVPALRDYLRACDVDADTYLTDDGRFAPFTEDERAALQAQYDEDLHWLRNGAGGFADDLDAPSTQIEARTEDGRGSRDDGEDRRLA